MLFEFPGQASERNTNLNRLAAPRRAGPNPHIPKSSRLPFLQGVGQSSCEASKRFNGRAEQLLQIESDFCFQEKPVIELIKTVVAQWVQNVELHKILRIFWIHAQNCAGLFEL